MKDYRNPFLVGKYISQKYFCNRKKYTILIIAIAKEGAVEKPTSSEFIIKHKLPAASSVKTALNALSNKEMIFSENNALKVYDVFFSHFLRLKF